MEPYRYLLLLGVWIAIFMIVALEGAKKFGHRKSRLKAWREVNSEWTELSQCSRTCGGGVAYRERTCSKSVDSLCESEQKYFLCNTQDCPNGSEDFRDAQCRQFDDMELEGVHYNWTSYYGAENQCALNCLAKGNQFYRRLADKVVDGTPCGRNTLDVCIDGICQPVGCDRVLGSKRAFDACLICGGYGATCKTLHGTIETQDFGPGYNQLILLPLGATSISIQEEGTSKNYFAVRSVDGVYYLNGNFEIGVAEPQHLGSTFFEYKRLHYGMEYLSAVGPLQEPLIIEMIISPGITPSVKYDYSVSYNASSDQTYAWIAQAWNQCNASCGFGYLNRAVSCISLANKGSVGAEFCHDMQKPSSEQICHRIKCSAEWHTAVWQGCSETCGDSGKQVRQVFCGKTLQGGHTEVVSGDQCPHPKPEVIRNCNRDVPCVEWNTEWVVGSWSQCSAACGGGQKRRELFCFIGNESVDLKNCDLRRRPDIFQDCNPIACDEDNFLLYSVSDCRRSQYGCCPDQLTAAEGRDYLGCVSDPSPPGLCIDTEFGCCPDGMTAADGPLQYGCHIPRCLDGCDKKANNFDTKANNFDKKANNFDKKANNFDKKANNFDKKATNFDKKANNFDKKANNFDDESSGSGFVAECELSVYGCCPNSWTAAGGPNHQGCHGYSKEKTDKMNESDTPTYVTKQPSFTESHISADHFTDYARSFPFTHGPVTERLPRDDRQAVDCHRSTHGCCSDGETPAAGPNQYGCPSEREPYMDTCEFTSYGCCPDGVTPALGPSHAHCPHLLQKAVTCTFSKAPGPCSNYSQKWSFDSTFGDCVSFEYGGCGGNENRFETSDTCRQSCVSPKGIERCYLPQSPGRCYRSLIRYYYDPQTGRCEEFIYGGCLGNENRFSTVHDCETFCIEPQKPDVCNQPSQSGPCRASINSYFFDHKAGFCRQFVYGGCAGNDNRFRSLDACEDRCGESLVRNCRLPLDRGPCSAQFYQWRFSSETGQCEEFKYGGCLGNANRFRTKMDCEKSCKRLLRKTAIDRCDLSPDIGPCRGFSQSWFYDQSDSYCKEFVYGGCGGNENRFESEVTCRTACDANHPIDVCTLPLEPGHCTANSERFYFESEANQCMRFTYGGCDGNGNNFQSLEECQKKCSSHIALTLPHGSNRCVLPRDPGPCVESMIRWHYSPLDRRCVKFEYGGCDGNRNRFLSESVCNHQCGYLALLMTSTTTSSIQLPHVPDTSVPAVQHNVFSTVLQEHHSVASTTPNRIHIPYVDWDENEVIPWFEDESEATLSPTKEFHAETNSVLPVQPDSDSKSPAFTESLLPDHHLYDTPVSWEDSSIPIGGTRGRTVYDATFVDETHRRAQKEEAPIDYGEEDDRMKEENSGEITDLPSASTADDILLSHTLPSRGKVIALNLCALYVDLRQCKNYTSWRWHYDHEVGECDQFKFGGCEGNGNNFETQEECELHCPVKEICQLPSEVGSCRAEKRRYFFDEVSGVCQQFIYSGCNGNANRFLTLDNCQRVCDTLHSTKELEVVSTLHYTSTPMTTTVSAHLPADLGDDVCNMHKDPGPCLDYQVVWYFEPVGRHCRRFYYGGCGGNDNRFNSSEDCRSRCLESGVNVPVNPREVSTIRSATTSATTVAPVVHSSLSSSAVETTPHFNASTAAWTLDEPDVDVAEGESVVSKCDLPQDSGRYCTGWQEYWYHDSEISGCRRFYYGGCDGNENRFVTEEECSVSCLETTGESSTTTAFEGDVCLEPKVIGPCSLSGVRWYFDNSEGKCLNFTYSGCQGNRNNFDTEKECTLRCREHLKEVETPEKGVCSLPKESGPCSADYLRFYWSPADHECRPFTYGGCQGNSNNFGTQVECYDACGGSEGVSLRRIHGPGDCFLPSTSGPCKAALPRWFYDSALGDCRAFQYGGCHGNRNNFLAYEDCVTYCSKVSYACGVLLCDLECPYGYEQGPDTCPICKCLDPCKDVVCPENSRCDVANITCVISPCSTEHKTVCKTVAVPVKIDDDGEMETIEIIRRSDVQLRCVASGFPVPSITWTTDGESVSYDTNHRMTKEGLLMSGVDFTDAGNYTCRAENGIGIAKEKFYQIHVLARKLPETCVDKPWYANCELIVEAGLCHHAYFSIFCCRTCHKAGHLP